MHWGAKNRQGRGNKPVTPAITKLHYLVLNNVLQFAAQNRAISVKPAQGVRIPTVKSTGRMPREPEFLTPAQVTDLAEAMPYPYDVLARFLAFTGLRVGSAPG